MMTSSEKALFASLFDIATYYAKGETPPYNVEGALASARKLLEEGRWFEEVLTPLASDEQISLQTENLSAQINDAVRRVSEPAIQAEAPVQIALPVKERNLVEVLEAMLELAPDIKSNFTSLFQSLPYTPPEQMTFRWEQAAHILNRCAQDHPKKLELIKIFNGK